MTSATYGAVSSAACVRVHEAERFWSTFGGDAPAMAFSRDVEDKFVSFPTSTSRNEVVLNDGAR
ncbi:hypothetical protein BJY59DRAFT_694811 [Rhodotorula toruloides]